MIKGVCAFCVHRLQALIWDWTNIEHILPAIKFTVSKYFN